MSLTFYPGSKPRFNKIYTYTIYQQYPTCACIQEKVSNFKSGYNNPTQSENMRVAQLLSNNLGGRITWGNRGIPAEVNYLGRVEGQPGGSLQPLRNKF